MEQKLSKKYKVKKKSVDFFHLILFQPLSKGTHH